MAEITDKNRYVDILIPDNANYEKVTPNTKASAVLDDNGRTVQAHISDQNIHTPIEEIEVKIANAIDDIKGGATDYDTLFKLQEAIKAINEIINVSDKEDLNTLQEVVEFILENKDVIEDISVNKVSYDDIINNLNTPTTQENKVLDARQGKVLKQLIDELETKLPSLWESEKYYNKDSIVIVGNTLYMCLISHTSSPLFEDDLTLGRWYQINNDEFRGATDLSAGEKGLVPTPAIIDRNKFLKGNGTWSDLPLATNSVAGVVKSDGETITIVNGAITAIEYNGATPVTDGTSGIVPAPKSADVDKFLKGNGTWSPLPIATSNLLGVIVPDNITIQVDDKGVLSQKREFGELRIYNWNPETEYKAEDLILHQNCIYQAKEIHTTGQEFDSTNYNLIASYNKISTIYNQSEPLTQLTLVEQVSAKENIEILVKGYGQLLNDEYTLKADGKNIVFEQPIAGNTDVQVNIFTNATMKNISGAVSVQIFPELTDTTTQLTLNQKVGVEDMLLFTVKTDTGAYVLQSDEYELDSDGRTVLFTPALPSGAKVEVKIFTNEIIQYGSIIRVDSYVMEDGDDLSVIPLTYYVSNKNLTWVNVNNTDIVISEYEIGEDNKSIVLNNPLEVGDYGYVRYFTEVSIAQDGSTYIPHMQEVGNGIELSWTNTNNLPNPEPVLIRHGVVFKPTFTRNENITTISWTNDSGLENPSSFNIYDGTTYKPVLTPAENGYTLSWTNDGGLENPTPVIIEKGEKGEKGDRGQDGIQGKDGEGIILMGNWVNNIEYPKLSMVFFEDSDYNYCYISSQIVPSGIELSNTEYWVESYRVAKLYNSAVFKDWSE